MGEFEKFFVTLFGGIITLAIISVVISRKGQAPAAITAISQGISSVVAAAVNPASTAVTNGNNGSSAFTTPGGGSHDGIGNQIGDAIKQGVTNALFSAIP